MLICILLLQVVSATSYIDIISHHSNYRIANSRRRQGMKRLSVNFISNNIGFNFWRRGRGNDLDGNDLDKVHHPTAHTQSDVVRMVRRLVSGVKSES